MAPAFVFHSIRKTVATLLQNSGSVPEFVAASILGHEWPTMTFGTYAGSVSMDEKRKAIEKLAYPGYPALDGDAA